MANEASNSNLPFPVQVDLMSETTRADINAALERFAQRYPQVAATLSDVVAIAPDEWHKITSDKGNVGKFDAPKGSDLDKDVCAFTSNSRSTAPRPLRDGTLSSITINVGLEDDVTKGFARKVEQGCYVDVGLQDHPWQQIVAHELGHVVTAYVEAQPKGHEATSTLLMGLEVLNMLFPISISGARLGVECIAEAFVQYDYTKPEDRRQYAIGIGAWLHSAGLTPVGETPVTKEDIAAGMTVDKLQSDAKAMQDRLAKAFAEPDMAPAASADLGNVSA